MRVEFELSNGGKVAAEYAGGEYVDVYLGGHSVPSEVINVWDYAKDAPAQDIHSPLDLSRVAREWVAETAKDAPDWYATYLANLPR